MLAFSRRQTLDPKPTNVNRLISGMEDLIRRTVGPQVTVEVVGAGGHDAIHPERVDADEPAAGQTVLVIEDEETIRTLVTEELQGLNCRVLTASDGPPALGILRSEATIDLLSTDVGLPGD